MIKTIGIRLALKLSQYCLEICFSKKECIRKPNFGMPYFKGSVFEEPKRPLDRATSLAIFVNLFIYIAISIFIKNIA